MFNAIIINDKNHTIEISKKFAAAAKRYGTEEYDELQTVRRDYPRYRVQIKTTSKKADSFKGLTFDFMASYIQRKIEIREGEIKKANDAEAKNEYEEVLRNFYLLRGKNEAGEDQDFAETATYGEIKKWFLEQFSELKIQRKTIDEILGKRTA